ncbi:sensor histidine kinase [Acetohalobium arabaticum]|uniref:histidine kinase n=1 Tax=Acetohalobium arabaticum (strain ATCC 49924 / DSM 5501 / Z-7288) TaxID=574087 RepID=D9QSF0_ACEAZ|nr:HAMP domain-containing sensor histidine kinase [Acetohalobium arabaticum]ADL13413.1 histidine kinase [Acetohalobium arabaticum DSM 5501]
MGSLLFVLKTPLNLIFSALQMLNSAQKNKSKEGNEKIERYTNIIEQNSQRLLRLVNNIVDITKIEAGSFTLNLQNYDIVKLIKSITYSVREYIEHKNKILEFNTDSEHKVIACDAVNIERIMLNLLSNAVKFTDEGDKITVSLDDKEDSILISIKDTGIGIEEEKQEIIFQQFGQANKSFDRNNEGSGIGLSIVKSLVELHDGEIRLNSEYSAGSEFIIELPAKKISEKDNSTANSNKHQTQNLTNKINIEFSDIYEL